MKKRSRYKVIIEDESRLETLAEYSASPLKWSGIGVGFAILFIFLASLILAFTPVRELLPGYLKESERTESQNRLLRLDSLQKAYETNAQFLENIVSVLNPSETVRDTAVSVLTIPLTPDSLIPTSAEEIRFASMMNEREKYNISVIAPLAAESMMFAPISDYATVSQASQESMRAEFIMAKGAAVAAIADGKVIAVSQSIRDAGSSVIIQHPKGFLSRCSGLGSVLVETGDDVSGGQIIALSNKSVAKKNERVYLEMWHNGERLVPYEYIAPHPISHSRHPIVDEEVGRGK